MMQIESTEAVENVEAIAAVDGIDIVFVGSQDLCASMGCPTQLDNPDYLGAIKRIADATLARGKIPAIVAASPEALRRHREIGYRMFICGADIILLARAMHERHKVFRDVAGNA